MKKASPYSLYILLPWSLALMGLVVVLGNLFGLAAVVPTLIPPIDNPPGLLASSLFFFALGLLFAILRPQFLNRG